MQLFISAQHCNTVHCSTKSTYDPLAQSRETSLLNIESHCACGAQELWTQSLCTTEQSVMLFAMRSQPSRSKGAKCSVKTVLWLPQSGSKRSRSRDSRCRTSTAPLNVSTVTLGEACSASVTFATIQRPCGLMLRDEHQHRTRCPALNSLRHVSLSEGCTNSPCRTEPFPGE